jgi:hypothetical protein
MNHKELSLALQSIAAHVQAELLLAVGEEVPFVLICQVDKIAQYVATTDRKEGIELISSLLERWKGNRADIPAHYNPDLKGEI